MEIARELDLDVSKIGHHISALFDANLIEEVDSESQHPPTLEVLQALRLVGGLGDLPFTHFF